MSPFLAIALALQGAAQTPPPQTPPAQTPAVRTPAPSVKANVVPPPKPAPGAVVATVDGKPVTAGEIEGYLWAWKTRDVINEYAVYQAVANEAAKHNITVTDAEIQAKVDSQLAGAQASLQPGQTIEGVLRDRGFDSSRLALSVRTGILLDKIAAADFKASDYIRIEALLFRPAGGGTPTPLATVKASKDADAAYASLAAGKPWDAVVKASTTPPAGTAQAIPAGWVALSSLPNDLRIQVAGLKLQGTTKPVQSPGGSQIIHLVGRGDTASPADLETLKNQYVNGARNATFQRIRAAMKVEIK